MTTQSRRGRGVKTEALAHVGSRATADYRYCDRARIAERDLRLIALHRGAVRFWFTVAVTASIVSFLTFLSRRLLFASLIASSLVAVVLLISLEKQATMHMGLHSYDLFFYLNASTLEFLWGDYRRYVVLWFLQL